MKAILDCGTTNTKCYIVDDNNAFLAEGYSKFGVKDNALKKNREDYKVELKKLVYSTIENAGKDIIQLRTVIGFGMISSDLGLLVVPHSTAPTSISTLQDGVFKVVDSIFGEDVNFYLIRGVKNPLEESKSIDNLEVCDFMRGEETQVVGILEKYKDMEAINVIMFGSHMKIIHVNDKREIEQSMTTMSGQVFDCIKNYTVVGKSVKIKENEQMRMSMREITTLAEKTTLSRGLMRALLFPRFMESFTDMNSRERLAYLDAVIAIEDIKAIKEYYGDGKYSTKKYYFIGPIDWCETFKMALLSKYPIAEVFILSGKEINKELSIIGATKITEKI